MKKVLCITWLISTTLISVFSQATLISQFDFNGNLNDNLSNGTCTSYNNSVTSYTSGSFNWTSDSNDAGGGLKITLPDAIFLENHYSILIDFKFSETSSYRKILDQSNRTSDQGTYVNYQLRLYSFGGYGSTTINPDSNFTIILTRDSTDDTTRLYLWDGVNIVLESFGADVSDDFVSQLSATNRVLHFFADDSSTTSEYSLSGSVNQIKIWNGIATASQLLGFQNEDMVADFMFYPNPTTNVSYVQFEHPVSGLFEVYTIAGELVSSSILANQLKIDLDLSSVPSGMYLARFNNKTIRFIRE